MRITYVENKLWKKKKKEKKRKKRVRSAHVGALDDAARVVAWSDRTLKWFCAMKNESDLLNLHPCWISFSLY
jgi:hypothetical protein